jgi:hypothetical protein
MLDRRRQDAGLPALEERAIDVTLCTMNTALDARNELQRLQAERLDAVEAGLGENALYMNDLDNDIEASRALYVGLAVTEIATLRAQLSVGAELDSAAAARRREVVVGRAVDAQVALVLLACVDPAAVELRGHRGQAYLRADATPD